MQLFTFYILHLLIVASLTMRRRRFSGLRRSEGELVSWDKGDRKGGRRS
jgi:hypothetical protein